MESTIQNAQSVVNGLQTLIDHLQCSDPVVMNNLAQISTDADYVLHDLLELKSKLKSIAEGNTDEPVDISFS